ncbi:MAG: GNAT family N-acetyltransferase [Candidatus Micrarchaeia archaeon]
MDDLGLPRRVTLRDGTVADIRFLSRRESVESLRDFINALVEERAQIIYDRKVGMKAEREWIRARLGSRREGTGYLLVAKVGGAIAGTSGADRGRFKERENVSLGLAIARRYRGIGLGEALLRINIEVARRSLKPRNIFLSVLSTNRRAVSLYRKVGFRKFALFPRWVDHFGKRVDHVFMKLD